MWCKAVATSTKIWSIWRGMGRVWSEELRLERLETRENGDCFMRE